MIKKKPSVSSSYTRYFLTRFLATLFATFIGFCGCATALSSYMSFGYFKTSLDTAMIPTAEYLYQHPQPTLEYAQITASDRQSVCYQITPSTHYGPLYTEIYVNGVRTPNALHFWASESSSLKPVPSSFIRSCLRHGTFSLENGIHLLELHLKTNPWMVYSTYQWAIKIEG